MPLEQIFYKGPQKQTLQSVVLNAILSDGSLFEEEKGGGGGRGRGGGGGAWAGVLGQLF